MSHKLVEGVFAALLTPRFADGTLDETSFVKLIEFLLSKGIRGFVLNGATGEFCLTTPQELERLTATLAKTVGTDGHFLCGIGTTSVQQSCTLAAIAARNGASAVLLPPPYFFPYAQEDVQAFTVSVADRVPLPVLLYNLPDFTTPIATATAVQLLADHSNIIGIKDSSGSSTILDAVTAQVPSACRIVGSDYALLEAIDRGLCDCVVSGLACVMPELIRSVFYRDGSAEHHGRRLNDLLTRLHSFPTPWGLKWIAEARGLVPANFAQALVGSRLEQGRQLQSWFRDWL